MNLKISLRLGELMQLVSFGNTLWISAKHELVPVVLLRLDLMAYTRRPEIQYAISIVQGSFSLVNPLADDCKRCRW
jgi:hypothetical protein